MVVLIISEIMVDMEKKEKKSEIEGNGKKTAAELYSLEWKNKNIKKTQSPLG